MSQNLRISIIIPCFNEERYLARCLNSIAAQNSPAYEVIVVNNNSVDKTALIANRYSFVKLLDESQQGRVFAQNNGFDASQGDILARIDADAVLPANWTQHIESHFSAPAMLRTAWTGGPAFYNVRLPRLTAALYGFIGFQANYLLAGHVSLWGSSMALPRTLWKQVEPEVCLRTDIHEDLDLAIHLHKAGYRIVYDKQTRVGAELRPAYASSGAVWAYLSMWPRTLRIHGIRRWVCCLPLNALIFAGTPFFSLSERLAHVFGRKPLDR